MVMAEARVRRTPEDWARAALEAIGEGGLTAVAVEALAPRVGASKGSFYWHFADRAALVDAALSLWEEVATEAVIREHEAVADPRARLRGLLGTAFGSGGRVDAALLAHARHAQVAPVLARVTARRIAFVVAALRDLGLPADRARHRALTGYAAFLGSAAIGQAAPDELPPPGRAREAYLDDLMATLTA